MSVIPLTEKNNETFLSTDDFDNTGMIMADIHEGIGIVNFILITLN